MISDEFKNAMNRGWRPNHVASEAELPMLQHSRTRGNCLSPLLVEGDEVWIDRDLPPQPGDIVSFALSQRFVDEQNADLPPGQSPWRKGDKWCKLYTVDHGFEMLHERQNAATATRLSCESGDGVPVLHPVRQVRRDGRFLFEPDLHAANIGANAATDIVEVSLASYSGSAIAQAIAIATVGAKSQAYTATVTASLDVWKNNTNGGQVFLAQLSGGIPVGTTSQVFNVVATSSPGDRIAIVSSFAAAAGASASFALWYSSGSVGNFGNAANIDLRVDAVKK